MDNRKEYVAPAIAWQDVLEQTSLACHATQSPAAAPLMIAAGCSAGVAQPVTFAAGCGTDVSKGGAFQGPNGNGCEINVDPQAVVVLS